MPADFDAGTRLERRYCYPSSWLSGTSSLPHHFAWQVLGLRYAARDARFPHAKAQPQQASSNAGCFIVCILALMLLQGLVFLSAGFCVFGCGAVAAAIERPDLAQPCVPTCLKTGMPCILHPTTNAYHDWYNKVVCFKDLNKY